MSDQPGTPADADAIGRASFPRQYARTLRFSLGVPRAFSVAPDGSLIAFLRTRSGTDRTSCLWVRDTASGAERVIADPADLLGGAQEELSAQERARRERSRQAGSGIIGYATDEHVRVAAFALSGRLFLAGLTDGSVRELPAAGPVVDPRPDPAGERVGYVARGALRVTATDGSGDVAVAEPDGPDVTFGLAEFIAAEEIGRSRGFWWSPDGTSLLAARVDNDPVSICYLSDPANPAQPPAEIRYPVAGSANADVTLTLIGLDGSVRPVPWETARFPYLVSVHWSKRGPALVTVQTRDQRTIRVLAVAADGTTSTLAEDADPDWVTIVPGTPARAGDGSLVRVVARDGAYRLMLGDRLVTPAGPGAALQVREVLDAAGDVLFTASADDPAQVHVYAAGSGGVTRVSGEPGVHTAARGGDVTVLSSQSLGHFGQVSRVLRGGEVTGEITSAAETPVLEPRVTLLTAGERGLRCALVLPHGYRPGEDPPLPVLLDPYGGPASQRAVAARNLYLVPQWFAEHGFAVLVADGRGTPGRGPAWDRLIHYDQATPSLQDQVDALQAVAAAHPYLDTSRVAIRGWSYGGYLAALTVLRRPDVFHAAVAGAPVTDKALYDTHYTERYLGLPAEHPDVYARHSLVADAPMLRRPLMLIHGLADDNVLPANTLRLSAALVAAGRPHTVLLLPGVTHMPVQEDVAQNMLVLQAGFLTRALGMDAAAAGS